MVPPYSNRADVPILLIFYQLYYITGLLPSLEKWKPFRILIPKYYISSITTSWLIWVHSPLLPESRLISFPIGTVMFYFPTLYFLWFTLGM
jgi:hypothetical protein